jgi:hypothetical protein
VAVADLVIKVVADVKDARKGLDDTEKSTSKWGAGLNKAAGVAAVGLAAVGGLFIAGAKSAAEDAQAQAILATALKNSAGATDAQVAATEDWISAQGRATGITDDELRPALGNLVRATGDVATAEKAASLAMDISAATGKDLNSVSLALAKAYSGNTASLGKLVPGIDQATLASKDMNAISAALAKQVGGSAAAAANTAAGQYKIFSTQLAETKEGIGAALLPVLLQLTGIMKTVATWAANNTKVLVPLIAAFAAVAAIIVTVNAVTKAFVAVQAIVKAATIAWTAVQWLLNAALTANPIGIVVVAIGLLVAALILAWHKSETFRNIVTGAFNAVASAIGAVVDAVKRLISWLGKIKVPSIKLPDLNPFSATAPTATAGLAATSFRGVARAPAARSATSGAPTIVINGAIDPEGTARAVQKVLVQHGIRIGRASTLATAQAI